MQLSNTSRLSIGRARTATARLFAVGLIAAMLSVAAFGFGSSPSGATATGSSRGDTVAPTPHRTPAPFVFTHHIDKSTPYLSSVHVHIKVDPDDIKGESTNKPYPAQIEILSW
jgi:hypothetical protein